MPGDPGSGARAEVHSGVEALGAQASRRTRSAVPKSSASSARFVRAGLREIREMPLGGDHEVTGCVREPVEQDEVAAAAPEHGRGPGRRGP